MDGTRLKREEVINKWFERADLILRKMYQAPGEKKLNWNDEIEADVKAISVSYLANYVGIVDPSLKPALLQIVSRLADLEIAEQSMDKEEGKTNLKLVE